MVVESKAIAADQASTVESEIAVPQESLEEPEVAPQVVTVGLDEAAAEP